MLRRPPRSTRTDTLFPYTTLFRSPLFRPGSDMSVITTIEQLEALYGTPSEASIAKEAPYITPHYRAFIEASPFVTVATTGPDGVDCSTRGDRAGFRSEARRVVKAGFSTCRARWSTYH